ncbi:pesticidal protein, partial [Bacillus wiedmannii]|nr:pesticidal protein [Bacillus wiedmannii]
GDFEILDEWGLGTQATIVDKSAFFKGKHLFLQPTNGIFSSYAYQKIDESKLKPYTRYKISGFISQSKDLEVVVSRYGKEIDKILNVLYEAALPITSGTNPTCCKLSPYPSCDGSQPDSHFFSYIIDVGKLYPDLNPGIEFGLRIVQPNGHAKVGNLEMVEERTLTSTEIQKIQRKEGKWKKAWDTERAEISATLHPVINQINAFYINGDWNGPILPHITYQQLANVILPALPKLKHWFMTNRPGEHYAILQQFKQALERVFNQLEEQNLIHNGSFTNELSNWLVEGDAKITTLEGGNLALQLSDWDASASQSIDISDFDEDKKYKLRVYAKGNGTIQDANCEGGQLSFDTNTFKYLERTLYFDTPSVLLHIQSEGSEFIVGSVELIELPDDE